VQAFIIRKEPKGHGTGAWMEGAASLPEGSKVLYAHLGGAPAINGYAYAFRNG